MESLEINRPSRDAWAGRRVFVTGCTGLLGGWLCRALADRGALVRGLTPVDAPEGGAFRRLGVQNSIEVVRGDLADVRRLAEEISDHGSGCVFHLAAQSQVAGARQDPAGAFDVNVRGTWVVLEAVRLSGRNAAVVLASSAAVYADGDDPHDEDEPLPNGGPVYATSKACAESIGLSYSRTLGVPVCAIRSTNLYGGGDTNSGRIVPGTIESVLGGSAPVIRSNGLARRDYLHVSDAVEGYLAVGEAMMRNGMSSEIFNLSSGQLVTVRELVDTILRVCGSTLVARVLGEASSEAPVTQVSSVKAHKLLGWRARVDLEAGLRETLDWYRVPVPAAETGRRGDAGV